MFGGSSNGIPILLYWGSHGIKSLWESANVQVVSNEGSAVGSTSTVSSCSVEPTSCYRIVIQHKGISCVVGLAGTVQCLWVAIGPESG